MDTHPFRIDLSRDATGCRYAVRLDGVLLCSGCLWAYEETERVLAKAVAHGRRVLADRVRVPATRAS